MIAEILPSAVTFAEAFADPPADGWLFPEEEALIAAAVEGRRREFTTVRACARQALGRLGLPPSPLLPGHRGAPRWPSGVVGSMTHCVGYRAATVAKAADITAIGIDAEPDAALPAGVLEAIAVPGELRWIEELCAVRPEVSWDRLLFSAKESVFKAWYPRMREELDFDQAAITVLPETGSFSVGLLVPSMAAAGTWLTAVTGRWLVRGGLIVTTLVVPKVTAADTTGPAVWQS